MAVLRTVGKTNEVQGGKDHKMLGGEGGLAMFFRNSRARGQGADCEPATPLSPGWADTIQRVKACTAARGASGGTVVVPFVLWYKHGGRWGWCWVARSSD